MDTASAYRSALEKRHELQNEARSMGIDEELISNLVDTFYGKIREDSRIAFVFDQKIGENWPTHLEKMKSFWRSVVLRTCEYSGKPVPAHQKLEGATPVHFDIWLELFEQTLREIAPNDAVVNSFMARAQQMAHRLSSTMFPEDSNEQES